MEWFMGPESIWLAGMLFTFVFLGLNTVLQPFCTLPLSRLQSCSLLAQIITLFGGLMLILQVC
jgi:hypothetical protein